MYYNSLYWYFWALSSGSQEPNAGPIHILRAPKYALSKYWEPSMDTVYIYIKRERERERDIYIIYIYMYTYTVKCNPTEYVYPIYI